MLDRGAKAIVDLAICVKAGGDVLVGVAEIVSRGIVGVAREIGEDAMDVHYVLCAVDLGEGCIVGARIGNFERLEGVKIASPLRFHRAHGGVVDGVHRLHCADLFGEFDVEVHFFTCPIYNLHIQNVQIRGGGKARRRECFRVRSQGDSGVRECFP